jgi:Na+/H+ antiporter NhaD/arsenite permease-like protein
LNIAATVLTAFNDNAAITYLSTLVPNFPASMRYAVVSGALTGGGLTIIANAPNPIGQSVLKRFFETGISAGKLFQYALLPTLLTALIYNFFS